jgi:mannose-6-phosphate isomerase-like protein (cupin superfamily)
VSFPRPAADDRADPTAPATRGFVLGPDDGTPYWWLDTLTLTKVTGPAARGSMDIVDHRVPAGYAPPPHVHTDQDEVFYVIDGHFAVTCGTDHWQAGPGSLVFLPRGVPHGFTVSAGGPGRTLLINAPAGFADVVTELGSPAATLTLPGPEVATPPPDRIAAVSEAHGIRRA